MITIKSWLEAAKNQIDALDAEVIAVQFFAPHLADRSWLVAHDDEILDNARKHLADLAVKKRHQGMPLAYVLSQKEFYGRNFIVKPGVLIPRPETETLIDLIKELDLPKRARFLDMGTGSGCIAVTLALEFPQSYVMAADISVRALNIADLNNLRFEGRVELVQSNLFQNLELNDGYPRYDECEAADDYFDNYDANLDETRFDVVVANLPYVNRDWRWLNLEELSFEPKQALFAKTMNGLSMYKRFFKECMDAVLTRFVVLEADPCQHADLIELAKIYGFNHLKTVGYGLVFKHKWYDGKLPYEQ